MLIKRDTRAGKDYCVPNASDFKTTVANNFFLTSRRKTVSVAKQFSSGIIRFFLPDIVRRPDYGKRKVFINNKHILKNLEI